MAHLVPLERLDPSTEADVGSELEPALGSDLGNSRATHLDRLIADYRDLTDVALRRRLETEQGLFLAEGSKVIQRAVAAGYRPRSALAAARWAGEVAELLDGHDVPVFVLPQDELARLTGYHVHRGALASMNRRPLPTVEEVLAGARRLVVLEGVVEPTNV